MVWVLRLFLCLIFVVSSYVIPAHAVSLILSTRGNSKLGGLEFRDGDLVEYNFDTDTATLFFNEDLFHNPRDLNGGADEDIDAIGILGNGHLVLSVAFGEAHLGGLTFQDGDLIEYDQASDTATLFFSHSIFSGDPDFEPDIDAVSVLGNGNLVLSTDTQATIGTNSLTFEKGELVEYDPTTGVTSLLFSDALFLNKPATGSAESGTVQIDAVSARENGNILLSIGGDYAILPAAGGGELRFIDGDVVEYDPTTGQASLFFSESLFKGDEDIDAVFCLGCDAASVPEPPTLLMLGCGLVGLLGYGRLGGRRLFMGDKA